MSSRLPTSALSRSLSSSIVSRNSVVASSVHSTSRCSRLVTDALIDASGVRRSCDTAASSAVRSSFASASPAAAATSARNRRRSTAICTWAANDRSTSRSSSDERRRRTTTSCSAGPIGTANTASRRGGRHRLAGLRLHVVRARRSPAREHRHRVGRERGAELRDELRQRILGRWRACPPSAASVSASARARAASAVRRLATLTSQLTTPATGEEHEEREQVLALLDGERVDRAA